MTQQLKQYEYIPRQEHGGSINIGQPVINVTPAPITITQTNWVSSLVKTIFWLFIFTLIIGSVAVFFYVKDMPKKQQQTEIKAITSGFVEVIHQQIINIKNFKASDSNKVFNDPIPATPKGVIPPIPITNKSKERMHYANYKKTGSKKDLFLYVESVGKRHGLPYGYMATTAWIESRMNPAAKRPKFNKNRTLAAGMYQFKAATGEQYGLLDFVNGKIKNDKRFDLAKATNAAAKLGADNKRKLESWGYVINIKSQWLEYGLHQQGHCGFRQILKAANNRQYKKYCGKESLYVNMKGNVTGENRAIILREGTLNKASAQAFLKHIRKYYQNGQKAINRRIK